MATQITGNFNYSGSNGAGIAMQIGAIKGIDQVLNIFRIFCDNLEGKVLPEEMKRALDPTLELSNYYAPIDTGELRGSAYNEARARRGSVVAEVGYGKGGEAPYAVFVHEHPELYHKPPTQAKFLQRAMDEDYIQVLARIAVQVGRRMRLR
jgi:hypothetical protein